MRASPSTAPAVRTPPVNEGELIARAAELAGKTLAQLAQKVGVAVPPDLKRHKGWVGQLMEAALGCDAASRDEPDFVGLGVELKTLPVDSWGKPLESTFVCTIPLRQVGEVEWGQSRVHRKLARVLWVPVEGVRRVPLAERRIGAALLWSPSDAEERALRDDWEELSGIIGSGGIDSITGHLGKFLQVRPKAANSRVRAMSIDAEGEISATLPRGFYLRTAFTKAILEANYALLR